MKKSRYTEEQIAFALKQAEMGIKVAEVIRGMGVSEQTFYRWKKVCGGLGAAELRRVKQRLRDRRHARDRPSRRSASRTSRRGASANGGSLACGSRGGGVCHRRTEAQTCSTSDVQSWQMSMPR
jgi:putative transposase